jgi:probable HAF family extracellular repeat protein
VSGDGTVVVGSSMTAAQNYRAFRWTSQAGMRALDVASPGIRESYATAVSGNGEVVVGWGVTPAGEAALIWDANHGWRTLEAALSADYRTPLAGWTLTRATAISDDAHTIAGYGTNPQGQTEAWRVKLSD